MNDLILWMDVETSGLVPYEHSLLEIAVILTDMNTNIIHEPYTALVRPAQTLSTILQSASDEAVAMHDSNSLWSDMWDFNGVKDKQQIEDELLEIVTSPSRDSVIHPGGTSLSLDLAFVRMEFPSVSRKLSHQVIDTSTIKLVDESLNGSRPYIRKGKHRALPDTWDAIEEYRHHISRLRSTNED